MLRRDPVEATGRVPPNSKGDEQGTDRPRNMFIVTEVRVVAKCDNAEDANRVMKALKESGDV
jgi:hypothetical protein